MRYSPSELGIHRPTSLDGKAPDPKMFDFVAFSTVTGESIAAGNDVDKMLGNIVLTPRSCVVILTFGGCQRGRAIWDDYTSLDKALTMGRVVFDGSARALALSSVEVPLAQRKRT